MTTDHFCFYLQNRLIQTSQTGGQWYSDTSPPLVFPGDLQVGKFYRIGPYYTATTEKIEKRFFCRFFPEYFIKSKK
jgi:hypothetical protein